MRLSEIQEPLVDQWVKDTVYRLLEEERAKEAKTQVRVDAATITPLLQLYYAMQLSEASNELVTQLEKISAHRNRDQVVVETVTEFICWWSLFRRDAGVYRVTRTTDIGVCIVPFCASLLLGCRGCGCLVGGLIELIHSLPVRDMVKSGIAVQRYDQCGGFRRAGQNRRVSR